ncbi:MAG: GDSL family lipase [Bacteroidetes bacterium]|nr:GDSL family lipase [Bacteroidota bacterium]
MKIFPALYALLVFANVLIAKQPLAITSDSSVYKNNPNYILETNLYDIYKTKKADVVMLGNSLTHGVNWNELLGRPNVVERGVPGDLTEGMLNRMNSVIKLQPKLCFILAGVNDVYYWIPVETIFNNYVQMISLLKSKNITPVIQSTLYAGKEWGKDWNLKSEDNAGRNKEIEKLNRLLREYATINNIDYIDLVSQTTNDNFLNPEITYDGIHLNAKGFKIWGREVEKILRKYGL